MIYEGLVSCENAARLSAEMDALKAALAKAHEAAATARASAPVRKSSPAQDAAAAIRRTEKAAKDAQRAVDALAKSEARAAAAGGRTAAASERAQARAVAASARAQARTEAAGGRAAAASVREQSRSEAAAARIAAAVAKAQTRGEAAHHKGLNSFSAKGGGAGAVSPWATHAKKTADEEAKIVKDRGARMKAAMREAAKMQGGGGSGGGGKDGEGGFHAPKDLKFLLKHAGIGKAAMGAMGAAAGLELSKLALGYRGMAMLGAISTRTGFQIRGLFSRVDPMPIVRAADKFSQLFNKATATGGAISGIFTRVFNSLFGGVEKAEPVFFAFAEGIVGGALTIENAYLRARIALLPFTDAIEDAIGPMDMIDGAATAGGLAIEALGVYATVAAAPVIAAAAAVTALVVQMERLGKLKGAIAVAAGIATGGASDKAFEVGGKEGDGAFAKRLGVGAAAAASSVVTGGAGAAAGAAGQPTGKAYADGIQVGVDSGLPGVAGAGKRIVDTLDKATRTAGEIRSPSRKAARTGAEFPAGTVVGIDSGAGDVEAAAARSMVPQMGGASGASSPSSSGGSFSAEAISLLRQIAENTRPRTGSGRAAGGWGEAIHEIAHVLGVPA